MFKNVDALLDIRTTTNSRGQKKVEVFETPGPDITHTQVKTDRISKQVKGWGGVALETADILCGGSGEVEVSRTRRRIDY